MPQNDKYLIMNSLQERVYLIHTLAWLTGEMSDLIKFQFQKIEWIISLESEIERYPLDSVQVFIFQITFERLF